MSTYGTSQPPMLACPHCGKANPAGAAFCEQCGKALPLPGGAAPRVVDYAGGFATTSAGQKLQGDELHKQAKKASGTLFAVAIIQAAVGALVIGVATSAGGAQAQAMMAPLVLLSIFGVAAIFLALGFWARKQPLPAAIVGLVLYVTLSIVDYVVLFSTAAATGGTPRIGVPWVKLIIIGILIQAIQAGAKHRKLLQEQAVNGPPRPF